MRTPITSGTFVALAVSAVLGYAAPRQAKLPPRQTPARPNAGEPSGAASTRVGSERNNRQQTITLTGCRQQGSSPRTPVLLQFPGTGGPKMLDSNAAVDKHVQRERTVETIEQTGSGC